MTIGLIIVVPGVAVLLLAAFASLLTRVGRTSEDLLVAPQNAGFGAASRLARAAATREQARTDLRALSTRKTDQALVNLLDDATRADQRAA